VNSAIDAITKERASVAAIHSRLQTTYAANLLLIDNYTEANSRAIDVDLALETAELARNQILQQAQAAVLAQANLNLQSVLQLLDF
jgi:flagellin